MDSIVRLTVELDLALHRQVCRLAESSGRSTAWIVDQALRRYVRAEAAASAEAPPQAGSGTPATGP
jgi:predicted transcriptional regulator